MSDSMNDLVYCPYCAYEGRLIEFRLKQKKGYSHRRKQCPDCFNIMYRETLTQEVTVKQWAYWLYNVCKSGDYEKIKFEKLFGRLSKFGINYEFWACWREAKEISREELRKMVDEYYEPKQKQQRLR